MEDEILKINILAITISGLLMMIAGIVLYYAKDHLSGGAVRFFLPIPPVGVAAYIFVFNMFKHYQGSVPPRSVLLSEMFWATIASGFFFVFFIAVLIPVINFIRNL